MDSSYAKECFMHLVSDISANYILILLFAYILSFNPEELNMQFKEIETFKDEFSTICKNINLYFKRKFKTKNVISDQISK